MLVLIGADDKVLLLLTASGEPSRCSCTVGEFGMTWRTDFTQSEDVNWGSKQPREML